ncbi:MAG: hypothetical protein GAK30_02411 [Paracidovorax wautersii]|uniref:Uncharacterized protein n=1 Tax=Paracidovorax wautersii TaxID=1177982 RepID=A0A7V8FN14_9BURK|nr:MAG: hypothetical protein GAK30_02411 [Paracidovorax wautersii]
MITCIDRWAAAALLAVGLSAIGLDPGPSSLQARHDMADAVAALRPLAQASAPEHAGAPHEVVASPF